MIRSMTAFAGAEKALPGRMITCEVRTVNHRFLDIALRIPDAMRFMEGELRSHIGRFVKRGRVDCSLSLKNLQQDQDAIRINPSRITQLMSAIQEVESLSHRPLTELSALDILNWPGVLFEPDEDRQMLAEHAIATLTDALQRLVTGRETEGQHLASLIEDRCTQIREQVRVARNRYPTALQGTKERLSARLAELSTSPDQDRLEQEMVYLAQKLDIAEEIDRLETHANELSRSLQKKEPVGRRLDFLLQELNREANTLGSKSIDADITRASIEIKVLLEQIREQVQNIE